ncbi:hypothetical protein BGX28_001863 [Mortierella sp. GBA30]|nr:hypothetical protein BGX28_001863 [Mortierella sp. GBA30]
MSFLISRRNKQPTRAQQRKTLTAQVGASSGPPIKRHIETKPAPEPVPGTYTDYKLVSTADDVLHHVMRFHGKKDVNPSTFAAPVKLHRKRNENQYTRGYNYYNRYNLNNQANNTAAKDADKKDAAGSLTTGAGATAAQPTTGADMALIAPYGGGVRNKQMLFKKRTKQVYLANEEERKKKEIESAPWVLEDYDGQNTWTGQLEGGQQANYYLFVFSDDGFKVVRADKWYKFNPKIQYATLTAEEAEEQYQKAQKQQSSGNRWLMRSKNKRQRENGEEGADEDIEGEQLITVDHEDEAGYDEDEARDRKRKRTKHGDVDEMDFDEIWQDDEEMPAEMPGFEDDAKDDPRKKYGQAVDSDEEEEDEEDKSRLNETGKAIKKALLKLEKNKVYADDDDKDPYASDQDSSDSDLDEIDKEKDVKKEEDQAMPSQDQAKAKGKGKANAKVPLIAKKPGAMKTPAIKPVSAKATKVKSVPLPNPRNASVQPLTSSSSSSKAGSASPVRSHSPTPAADNRSSSPPAAAHGRSGSPAAPEKKRKKPVEGESKDSGPSKKSTRPADAPVSSSAAPLEPGDDSWLITQDEIVSVLKSRPKMTTRDLIVALGKKVKRDPRNKNLLASLVRSVAVVKDGVLVLREGF